MLVFSGPVQAAPLSALVFKAPIYGLLRTMCRLNRRPLGVRDNVSLDAALAAVEGEHGGREESAASVNKAVRSSEKRKKTKTKNKKTGCNRGFNGE